MSPSGAEVIRQIKSQVQEVDPAEVSEQRWFDPEALPPALAPPNTLTAVLEVWEATRVRTR